MIHIVTLEKMDEWDAIVTSFDEYDVYYLSGYARGFYLHGDGEPMLVYYTGMTMRAIQVVMKRDISQIAPFQPLISGSTLYDFCTPYGYGGWIIEGNNEIDTMMQEYDIWCKANGVVSEFVRYHPQLQHTGRLAEYYEQVYLGNTVEIPLLSEQRIWENFTSKNRNVIRKAIKNGLTVHSACNLEIYEVFAEIYAETMRRDHADSYYFFSRKYFESICRDLKHNSAVFYVETPENKIIAAAIILFANGRIHYHLSGSLKEYQSLAPTNLLLYEVARWGAENGYCKFHLGGGLGARADSLFAFKKAFYRGEPLQYHIGKRIVDATAYWKLVNLREDIENKGFFPQYRG